MPRAARADEIIDVAAQVLRHGGIDAFVMRRIAEQAEMRLGHLQYYFPTRDDLLEAVVRREFDADRVIIERSGESDPETRLAGIVRQLVQRWTASAGSVYLPIGLLALHNERFERVLAEIYASFYDLLVDEIAVLDPTAGADECRRRAVLITSLIDGASLQPGAGDRGVSGSFERDLPALALAIARGRLADS